MDESSIDKHISHMMEAEIIGVDTETTGLQVKDGRDYCMGISVAYRLGGLGIVTAYFPFRHPDDNLDRLTLAKLRTVLETRPVVFHNAKFDLHSLATLDISVSEYWCSMVMAHMVNEEWPSKGLDYLSKMLLKDQKQDKDEVRAWADAFGWHTVPVKVMEPYARHDAALALRLFEALWPMMKEQELNALWPTEQAYASLLYAMERRGVRIDRDFCRVQAERGYGYMDAIADELGWNPASTNSLSAFLLDELGLPVLAWTQTDQDGNPTDKSKPSFTKKEMEQYDEMLALMERREARLVLAYRGWSKASSFLDSIQKLTSPDERVRPDFKQHGTVTGRLACVEPNLQQIPRNGDKPWNRATKSAFVAEPGFQLWEFDYSQLEFRLAASYGGEDDLIRRFGMGEDPFLPTALEVFGGVEHRQSAKTLTYSSLYGAGVRRIKNALALTEQEATDVRERYRQLYPGIYRASATATTLAKKRGYVRYWTGRRRHFGIRDGQRLGTHKAFNAVIQGGAAELVKRAGLRLAQEVDNDETCRMVLTVHDSWVFEIREDLVEHYKPQIIKIMTDFPDIGVKLDVDAKLWGSK